MTVCSDALGTPNMADNHLTAWRRGIWNQKSGLPKMRTVLSLSRTTVRSVIGHLRSLTGYPDYSSLLSIRVGQSSAVTTVRVTTWTVVIG